MDLTLFYGKNYDKKLDQRYEKLYQVFSTEENCKPEYVFSSPGRAEILGNHTDHNHGIVMVASINCDILCFVKKNDDGSVKLCSEGYPDIKTDINDLQVNEKEYSTSLALIKGVMAKLKQLGNSFGGFTAYTTSNIFKGAGVSSSAAFEVLICEIFNQLYLDNQLTPVVKAIISQYSENVYFGKPCGLLDQCGIAIGNLTKIDFNDPTNPIVEKLQAPEGYSIVLTNTGGDHAKLTPHYASIRGEMEQVAGFFGKKVLKEVDYQLFLDSMPQLKQNFSSRAVLRAMHFYSENKRVDIAKNSLQNNDVTTFLNQVNLSGESSLAILQNCYVPGETNQPVALAIEYSKRITTNCAFRVHGGGFAGSILGYVENGQVANYTKKMAEVFGSENVFTAQVRPNGTIGFKL